MTEVLLGAAVHYRSWLLQPLSHHGYGPKLAKWTPKEELQVFGGAYLLSTPPGAPCVSAARHEDPWRIGFQYGKRSH